MEAGGHHQCVDLPYGAVGGDDPAAVDLLALQEEAGLLRGPRFRLAEAAGDCPERARIELTRATVSSDPASRELHLRKVR